MEIVPFSEAHVEAAAELLAARHARHRETEPLLPADVNFRAEVEAVWRTEGASGSTALRGGHVVGYLVGAPRDEAVWGKSIWVELAGQAVEDPEAARDLYGLAAARWAEEGRNRHHVLVPNDGPLVEAWFRIGFGQQQAHGYREIVPYPDARVPADCEIREPTSADIDELVAAEIDLALPRHQQASPVFSLRQSLPSEQEIRKEWADTISKGDEKIFVGYREGHPVACWSFEPAELSSHFHGLGLPYAACYLAYAVTLPAARSSGLGLALTATGFAWAAEQDYSAMVTDWRVTNLLASRFWPKRGFRPSFLRLYRSIR